MKKSSKRFVLSDESVNVYGFKVITAGIDLTAFRANPIMLYDHDYGKPIGQWTDIEITGTQLTGVPMFDEEDPEAMKFYSKVEQGILKGASIGIMPLQFNEATNEMARSSIKETSITPVPANKNAIAIYNAKGQKLSAKEAKEFLLSLKPETPQKHQNGNMNQKLITALVALSIQAGHNITLSANSTEDEFEGAIRKVGEKLTNLSAENLNLSTKLNKIETDAKAAKQAEIETLVTEAVNDKRLSADEAQDYRDLGHINLSMLKKNLEKLKPVELHAVTSDTTKPGEETKGEKGKEAWNFDQYAEAGELETLQLSNPKKFQALLSAKQTQARQKFSIEA